MKRTRGLVRHPPRVALGLEDRYAPAREATAQRTEQIRALQISPGAQQTIDFWSERFERPEFIYFIRPLDGEGPVKIGRALDPLKRLRILQIGCWVPLAIWAVILSEVPGNESTQHEHWASARMHGEWFGRDREDEILETADTIANAQMHAYEAGEQLRYLAGTIPRLTLKWMRLAA